MEPLRRCTHPSSLRPRRASEALFITPSGVSLDTGPNVAVDILFAHPRNKPSASLHESLALATVDTPGGIALKVDERRETSMPGIYAAGDQRSLGAGLVFGHIGENDIVENTGVRPCLTRENPTRNDTFLDRAVRPQHVRRRCTRRG